MDINAVITGLSRMPIATAAFNLPLSSLVVPDDFSVTFTDRGVPRVTEEMLSKNIHTDDGQVQATPFALENRVYGSARLYHPMGPGRLWVVRTPRYDLTTSPPIADDVTLNFEVPPE